MEAVGNIALLILWMLFLPIFLCLLALALLSLPLLFLAHFLAAHVNVKRRSRLHSILRFILMLESFRAFGRARKSSQRNGRAVR